MLEGAVPTPAQRRTIAAMLDGARSRIDRLDPAQALAATRDGALIVDIRAETDRARNGIVPGSLHIPRTVLEWRLDPDSEWRSPYISGLDQSIILLCDHGYSSSLAAATLLDLGFRRVADVIGGFQAWRNAGLPIGIAPPPRPTCDLAGMRPPDSSAAADAAPSTQQHWDTTFEHRGSTGVSWYQPVPDTSLALIETLDIHPNEPVIDVGAGASSLVDRLIEREFRDISVLDISQTAQRVAQERVGPDTPVTWIHADVLNWRPDRQYALWHDRAMFHFLIAPEDRQRYLETLHAAVQPGGAIIVGVFATDGPQQCSSLPVQRYSEHELASMFGPAFDAVRTIRSEHRTPTGAVQPFTWLAARRRNV